MPLRRRCSGRQLLRRGALVVRFMATGAAVSPQPTVRKEHGQKFVTSHADENMIT